MVEHDYTILRQVRKLAVRDLLYMQAEICELEYGLRDQVILDANASDERRFYDREWWRLHQGKRRGFDGKQWKLVLRVRAKLREYCKWHTLSFVVATCPVVRNSCNDM